MSSYGVDHFLLRTALHIAASVVYRLSVRPVKICLLALALVHAFAQSDKLQQTALTQI